MNETAAVVKSSRVRLRAPRHHSTDLGRLKYFATRGLAISTLISEFGFSYLQEELLLTRERHWLA